MLDEENLRRLAEMGIDVYVPRLAEHHADASPAQAAAGNVGNSIPAPRGEPAIKTSIQVVLLGDAPSARARGLMTDIVRALGFAHVACARGDANDEALLAATSALVMFGERQVRAAGALVPAQRQREIGWVAAGELDTLAGDGAAKRALWSELKRMARELAGRSTPARP